MHHAILTNDEAVDRVIHLLCDELKYSATDGTMPNRNLPVHAAATHGKFAAVKVLSEVTRLACLRRKNIEGQTPYDVARQFGHDDVAAYILDCDEFAKEWLVSDPDDSSGLTPSDWGSSDTTVNSDGSDGLPAPEDSSGTAGTMLAAGDSESLAQHDVSYTAMQSDVQVPPEDAILLALGTCRISGADNAPVEEDTESNSE